MLGCQNKDINYFSYLSLGETISLPDTLPNIKQIVSYIIESEIISIKTIDSMKGLSIEGQCLSGKKIILQVKLKQKLLYVGDVPEKTIHTFQNEYYKSATIAIPSIIKGSDPEKLIENKYLQTNIELEDYKVKKIDCRTIFNSAIMYIYTTLIPTHELCYCVYRNKSSSNIFISFENGLSIKQLTFSSNNKNIKPLWSPDGSKIAFLSNENNKSDYYLLYVYYLKNSTVKRITDISEFDCIYGFNWSSDGRHIVFSGSKNEQKDIYIVDINILEYTQLTFGTGNVNSFFPKCSHNSNRIAFLENISGITNLCIMNMNGLDLMRLTLPGHIHSFNWDVSEKNIVCIIDNDGKSDEILVVNTMNGEFHSLKIPQKIINIKKACYSPCNNYISFIGSDFVKEDIFIYDIKTLTTSNLTKNPRNAKISDLIWKTDSSDLYYAANTLQYFNIHSISIDGKNKHQITNTICTNIKLNYRPRIV